MMREQSGSGRRLRFDSRRAAGPIPAAYLQIFWIGLILLVWELTARFAGFSPIILPRLLTINAEFIGGIASGALLASTLTSLALIAVGLAVGTVLALLLTMGAHFSRQIAALADVLTSAGHPVPGIALLPLVILWFGTGSTAVIVIIVHSVLWPMVVSIRSGLGSVPLRYIQIGRNYELAPPALFFRLLLPASLPHAISGLKISWARAWRAVISAEMVFGAVGGNGGLGWYLYNRRVFMDTPGLFAGILMLILVGISVENLLFNRLERRTLHIWGNQ